MVMYDSGVKQVELTGSKVLQLPDFVTGTLAAGAAIIESSWNDVDGFKTVGIVAKDPSALALYYIEHHYTDNPVNNVFHFYTAMNQTAASNNGRGTDTVMLRYYRNYVKNTDTVAHNFTVKRRFYQN